MIKEKPQNRKKLGLAAERRSQPSFHERGDESIQKRIPRPRKKELQKSRIRTEVHACKRKTQ